MRTYKINMDFMVSPELCIVFALCLLILPVRWVIAWVVAAAVHEMYHYAAMKACGIPIFSMKLGIHGAIMETDVLSNGREFLCAAAGPIGSMLLILLAKWFPRVAICGFVQATYNLLPVFPLDGGRVIRCALRKNLPVLWADRVECWVKIGLFLLLTALSTYATFVLSLGPIPLLFIVLLCLKTWKIKIPCKPDRERVQ